MPALIRYINRLSDHLFVLARALNDNGAGDVLWVPGRSAPDQALASTCRAATASPAKVNGRLISRTPVGVWSTDDRIQRGD